MISPSLLAILDAALRANHVSEDAYQEAMLAVLLALRRCPTRPRRELVRLAIRAARQYDHAERIRRMREIPTDPHAFTSIPAKPEPPTADLD